MSEGDAGASEPSPSPRPASRGARLRAWARRATSDRWHLGAVALAVMTMLGVTLGVLAPMLARFDTYGFHDWDFSSSARYITVLSLKRYHEAPFWQPWLCGGFPSWGHYESSTNLVSPYLPVYLLADLRTALRVEILGSALTGLAGSYLFARRFTKSVALATFVAIVYTLNGRWALQTATGHTWHLQYGWTPWVFWFFDRGESTGNHLEFAYAGAVLALMVYLGALYPLPQTALALGVYALLLAVARRRLRPLIGVAVAGVTAVGLGAAKLFAVLDGLGRVPRLIESKEVIGLRELVVMMTEPKQSYYTPRPIAVPAYGWHEWGIYVGSFAFACLIVGLFSARGARENALRFLGLLFLLLGFGAFHEHSPWALLHKLPIFASQHVPSRFLFPMVLFLGIAFVSWASRWVDRAISSRRWLDVALLVPVIWVGVDIATVSNKPISEAFWMERPDQLPEAPLFEQHQKAAAQYKRRDWAPPILLSMFANKGVIECYGIDLNFKAIGAIAKESPDFKGNAYVAQGTGTAEVVEWSPNRATVKLHDASPDALVVYNMNWFPSWTANGKPALDYQHAVAARVPAGTDTVVFRYFPRTLKYSLPVTLLTLGALAAIIVRRRRRARARSGTDAGITE